MALNVSDSLANGADLRLDGDSPSPALLETPVGVQPEGVVPSTIDISPTALTAAAEPAPGAEPRAARALEAAVVAAPADASGFTGFGLSPELLSGLAAIGFQDPSPIQRAAIPELMLGRDLVGQAQTGTGKTAAFALPLLERLDPQQRNPQVLVLTPTRELALQVAEAFNSCGPAEPGARTGGLRRGRFPGPDPATASGRPDRRRYPWPGHGPHPPGHFGCFRSAGPRA